MPALTNQVRGPNSKLECYYIVIELNFKKNVSFCVTFQMWSERLEKISSINEQLSSHVALNIMMNLEDSHSTYAQSFHIVKREIAKV